jgi:hypothetical protein
MPNGRCRLHDGQSTGPRTEDGLRRLRAAHTMHGFWTDESRDFRVTLATLFATGRMWLLVAKLGRARRGRASLKHRLARAISAAVTATHQPERRGKKIKPRMHVDERR